MEGSYSKKIALIYVFNLVVGVGCLSLPNALNGAGLILGPLFLLGIAFLAYISVSYMNEAISLANMVQRFEEKGVTKLFPQRPSFITQQINKLVSKITGKPFPKNSNVSYESSVVSDSENQNIASETPRIPSPQEENVGYGTGLESPSEERSSGKDMINSSPKKGLVNATSEEDIESMQNGSKLDRLKRIDFMTDDTKKFIGKNIAQKHIQEYYANPFSIQKRNEMGKLTEIFLGPIGKFIFYFIVVVYLFGDLVIYAVAVPMTIVQVTGALNVFDINLTYDQTYYLYVFLFGCVVGPLSFLNMQKTKYLQMATLITRYTAFTTMILLGFLRIFQGQGASISKLRLFDLSGLGVLYGATVYSFMCHHSIPSIIQPILYKKNLERVFISDYIVVFLFYAILCYSAMFAFGDVEEKNCPPTVQPGPPCKIQSLYTLNFTTCPWPIIGYFLSLFPVFTITSSYPMIAITLRNNLITLFEPIKFIRNNPYKNFIFSFLAAIPPIFIGFLTTDLGNLVGIVGSFAGMAIEFVFPSLLVLFGRWKINKMLPKEYRKKEHNLNNPHYSFFGHWIFICIILLLSAIGLVYNTIAQAIKFVTWVASFFEKK